MRYAGIDIGSRTIRLAVLENGRLVLSRKSGTSHNPLETAQDLMDGVVFDTITATGYGRHLIKGHFACPVISEISAFTLGARFFPTSADPFLTSAVRTQRPFHWIMKEIYVNSK